VATLDLLRALDSRLDRVAKPASERALQLLAGAPSLRTRYLLVQPLAHLSVREPRLALALKATLTDPDPMLRTEAARSAPALEVLLPELLRLAADPHVRVREAAVTTLGRHAIAQARPRLLQLLEGDAWPIVRAASVRALKELPGDDNTRAQLAAAAAADSSAEVRRPALIALAALGARDRLPVIRERFLEDEDPFVRAAAAQALGQLCDRQLVDELTREANKLARFGVSERDGIVGAASLATLAELSPSDLRQRLQPFFRPGVPIFVQGQALAALQRSRTCPR
jgi:HEAT repeat protein